MNKFVTLKTMNGAIELPFYVDNRELAEDVEQGLIHEGDLVLYMRILGEVIGNIKDCDGAMYTEILEVSQWNPTMVAGRRETGRSEPFTLNTVRQGMGGFGSFRGFGFSPESVRDFVFRTANGMPMDGWTVQFS